MNEDSTGDSKTKDESPGDNSANGNRDENQDERLSILTVARVWWPWCLGLIFVLTIVWTALVAWTVIAGGNHTSISQTIVAIISASAPGEFLIIIYSLMIVTALEYGGGYVVVTAKYLTSRWVKPLQDKFRQEGREEGLQEGRKQERQFWIDRERRRAEAEAQGIPFDEPFPGMEDEPPSNNGTAVKK